MTAQYEIHHNPANWEDPEEFRPERFLDQHGKLLSNTHIFNKMPFVPFGRGKRTCFGKYLALDIVLCCASMTLKHFTLKLPNGYQPDMKGQVVMNVRPTSFPVHFCPR